MQPKTHPKDAFWMAFPEAFLTQDLCAGLDILAQLLNNLRNNDLNKDVKPPIIACFGDIALAIGVDFERYLNYVMPMIGSAMQLSRQALQSKDEDMIDFNNALRGGIFEAYSGIFQEM